MFSSLNKEKYDKLKGEIFSLIKKHKNNFYYKNKEEFDQYISNIISNEKNKTNDFDLIENAQDKKIVKKISKKLYNFQGNRSNYSDIEDYEYYLTERNQINSDENIPLSK